MQHYKLIAVAAAVAASLNSPTLLADEANIESLEKRIMELESKVVELDYYNDQQPSVLTPDTPAPEGVIFSGYARYGAHYADGDKRYVQIGSTGAAVGRLGNEGNGGEFQLGKIFRTDSGVVWNLGAMLDHWANDQWGSPGGVDLKKLFAGVTNVFESQPDLYLWAGRDFHQRPQQGINDYFWMMHDGQGAGFKNLDIGAAKFDLGFVGQIGSGTGGSLGNDTGVYALTSKLHGINAGVGALDIYANYGFASREAGASKEDETSWQLGATLGLGDSNKIIVRYSNGADNSSFDLSGDMQVLYTSFEGSYNYGNPWAIDYLVSYKDFSGEDTTNKSEYSGIVRPMYSWNEVHSTWFEAGYALVDYENGDEERGWKVTASQNISLGGMPWSRPMLRLYTTVGEVDDASNTKHDTVSVGAMFEAWW
ncbi:carbohydrate porin [Vibrio cholerae]|uniref:carbohydrate porin n=1 Tax=Vibrio cholerae TaxID=666 RepID=UPI0011D3A351|nr:carbohydrate porin [Vibrio cholerae]TXX93519.1 carbohydrate porin [Vibrio cholerae]GHW11593.1 maltoporin [Vibrio cholerae]